MSDYTLYGDFAETDDPRQMARMRKTDHGVFRAVVERDEYPDAPYDAFACPVWAIDRRRGLTFELPQVGDESWKADGIDHDMAEVWERMDDLARPHTRYGYDTVDLVDRYLRIFHGGSAKLISSTIHQGGDDYLVYDTRAMRERRGQTGETLETSDPSAEEWQAYIDGEVYVIWVEQADDFDEDGEPATWTQVGDGPVGGFYGDDCTAQAAIEALESTIEWTAANMLPLEA